MAYHAWLSQAAALVEGLPSSETTSSRRWKWPTRYPSQESDSLPMAALEMNLSRLYPQPMMHSDFIQACNCSTSKFC
uniref:Uncharacterized protein n=1 Tax=Kalanchoe fedtschenkoi TaxID=63787 RepID=A0A7N0ZWW3_KALFE